MQNLKFLLVVSLATTILVACTALQVGAQVAPSSSNVQTVFENHYADGLVAQSLLQTADGNYVLTGSANRPGGGTEGWLATINASGQEQWEKVLPGNSNATNESINSLQETSDGGFILAGGEQVNGLTQPLLNKVGADGVREWGFYYDSFHRARADDAQQTRDGGYIMVGDLLNNSPPYTPTGSFVAKMDNAGNQVQNNTFSWTANTVQLTQDGGYAVAGQIGAQPSLVKLDSSLDVKWSYSGRGDGGFYSVQKTNDGGYICAGWALRNGNDDALLLKIDANGNEVWMKTFGGAQDDWANSAQQTSDGGFILGGATKSLGNVGAVSPWLIKANADGTESWNQTWANVKGAAWRVLQTSDGGYVFTGTDAATNSPYVIKTTGEAAQSPSSSPIPPAGGMVMGIVLVVVLVGLVGMGYMRRSKRTANRLEPGPPSGDGITQATGSDLTQPPFAVPDGTQYGSSPPVEQFASASAPSFPLELGAQFSDVRYLGEGGFARVFSALNLQGTPVAVKVLKSRDPKVGKLFTTEAANSSVLRHENIVRLFDYNIFPVPYLATELCDGSVERERSGAPLSIERGIEIMKQVVRGLSYAHKQKILHGDIKPSNILLKENVVKISDWGLSKLKTEQSVSIAGVTLQYAAPEELSRQFGRADERTDIYQTGVLFYQLVTGKLPFADDASLVDAILQDTPIPPSQVRPMSPKLETIILTCLRKRKEERYQTMDELFTDIDGVNNQV